ncbi:MAG: CapA family protein [Bacteroidales bacterium]|nr:CapA family protein [Bacteroidales bacterium]
MKHILPLLCGLSVMALSLQTSCHQCKASQLEPVGDSLADSAQHISLLVAGDLMQHDVQIKCALMPDSTYDYSSYFAWVKPEIERADVAIANLEVTLAGKPYKGYPQFSAPDEYLYAIKEAGFDLLTTTNNHACDRGLVGVLRTIQMCDSVGMPHLGTYVDSMARVEQYPYMLEKNGFRIALINFTYGTNELPTPKPTHVNRLDTAQIAEDILKAKSMNPDLIIALPHWGIEYETLPRKSMVKLAQWMLDKGVHHVVGGHPHVVQPIELRQDSLTGEKHLVAYSLGNFVSDQAGFPKYGGMMLRMEFVKEGPHQPARIADCGYTLTFVARPDWSKRKNHRIYPVNVADSLLNTVERQKRDTFVTMARDLFAKHNLNIQEYFIPEEK